RDLRAAGYSYSAICGLRLGDVSAQDDTTVIRQPGCASVESGSAEVFQRYVERRSELALDCSRTAPLIVDLDGAPLSVERLETHYESARTVRVRLAASG